MIGPSIYLPRHADPAMMHYEPSEDGTRFLAWQLSENYGAAGFYVDPVTIWLEARDILIWRHEKEMEQHSETQS